MVNFNSVYIVVLFIALAQWGFMRYQLVRGLEAKFKKTRQELSMEYFFQRFTKPYLLMVAWMLFHVFFVLYCAMQLLSEFGVLNFKTVFFSVVAMIFFSKDRIYYVTAMYVIFKTGK